MENIFIVPYYKKSALKWTHAVQTFIVKNQLRLVFNQKKIAKEMYVIPVVISICFSLLQLWRIKLSWILPLKGNKFCQQPEGTGSRPFPSQASWWKHSPCQHLDWNPAADLAKLCLDTWSDSWSKGTIKLFNC